MRQPTEILLILIDQWSRSFKHLLAVSRFCCLLCLHQVRLESGGHIVLHPTDDCYWTCEPEQHDILKRMSRRKLAQVVNFGVSQEVIVQVIHDSKL